MLPKKNCYDYPNSDILDYYIPLKTIKISIFMIPWYQHTYGLTGSIGAGKTTVCGILRRLGAYIINADDLARKAVEPGSNGLRQIAEYFGNQVLNEDGSLNRHAMGRIVFSDPQKRATLEDITHPLVENLAEKEYNQAILEHHYPIIYDVPLLFEAGLHLKGFKGIIVIFANENQCIDRLISYRNMAQKEAIKRYHCQIPITEKIALADYVIDNTKDLVSLESQVVKLFNDITSSN